MDTVVFLPGYLAPPAGFRSLAEGLPGYRTLELPCSPNPMDVAAWQDIPQQAHLIAFAEASWAAVQLAAAKNARSLVLFSPILRCDAALEARLQALQTADSLGKTVLAEVARPWFFGAFFLEQGQEAIQVWLEQLAELDVGQWLTHLCQLPDGRKYLRLLNCPVLVALGAEDVFTPLRYGQEVVDWTPLNERGLGAVRVSLEGCGHLAPWENPLEAANLIEGFIARADSLTGHAPNWDELPMS